MSTIYGTQLEPFEENQSPSPNETTDNPYETALAARSTSLSKRRGSGPPSPVNTVNTLHRQLSGDPESPPPAWKRRPTVSNRQSRSPPGIDAQLKSQSPSSTSGDSYATANQRSPSQSSVRSRNSLHSPSGIRRPPTGLTMTTASPKPAVPLPNGMFLHESPNGSSVDLTDHDLALPNPAFRRRVGNGTSSNRSSIASNQDLSSLTSEELWSLGQEQDIPDMSNPLRQAAERPLDTVKRESRRLEKDQNFHSYPGLPGDVIWPTAPPLAMEKQQNIRSKSFTNVATLGMAGRRASRRTKSRQSSIDIGHMNQKEIDGLHMHNASQPNTPGINGIGVLSSAHSSSTSLASQNILPNKSFSSLNGRPPSTYYSRDFLSSLAPREGGYAIAAQMGGGLGAVGTMSVEEKRRSIVTLDEGRSPRTMGSRAPPSKSAGMGRWSLDGGENYGRPYGTPSAATTSSNLSAPPINSAEPSPSIEEKTLSLPAGASPAYNATAPTPSSAPGPSTTPPNSSPLASQTSHTEEIPPSSSSAIPPPPAQPITASTIVPASTSTSTATPTPALNNKKSKKQLAKENKALEKAEAAKVARQRAEAARAEALKKQAEREEAKRKEKEEKARKKAEKKAAKKGKSLPASTSTSTSITQPTQPNKTIPPITSQHATPTPAQTITPTLSTQPISTSTSGTPFPKPIQSSQSAYKVPVRDTNEAPRQTHKSMPLNAQAPTPRAQTSSQPTPARPPIEGKRSLFGTIKKRFSFAGSSSENKVPQSKETPPPVPKIPTLPASPVVANGDATPKAVVETPLPTRTESSLAKVTSPTPTGQISISSGSTIQPQVPTSPRQQTQTQIPSTRNTPSNLILGKTLSREGTSSPPSSSNRKRNSLHGPRPMPNANVNGGQSRPSSIITHESTSIVQPNKTSISGELQQDNQNVGGPVTPSTTGDSNSNNGSFFLQSHNSNMTNITPITSPEDTDSFSNTGDSQKDGFEPKREQSGDSNKTVHASNGLVSSNQPILV